MATPYLTVELRPARTQALTASFPGFCSASNSGPIREKPKMFPKPITEEALPLVSLLRLPMATASNQSAPEAFPSLPSPAYESLQRE